MTDKAEWHPYTEKSENNNNINREAQVWAEDAGGRDIRMIYIKEENLLPADHDTF